MSFLKPYIASPGVDQFGREDSQTPQAFHRDRVDWSR